ncbi:NAD(P)-dependent dehydrogenase (short-subunit alcohol dehydrogenase family) [Rhizobium sp. PP-WC-2G-219]|nr:NAD(P)-dependent dehydrogenase (short-subunit alcohol dehydrogenase family) [Rhizobium sp. PP-WC-2G-219]
MMSERRQRPVAVVTGGRRGIGLSIASCLAAAGYDIVVTGIGGPETAKDALAELRADGKADAIYIKADICDVAGHAATVDDVMARFGRIDCLVNNAGMASVVRGDFLGLSPDHYDLIMATNLKGTVFFTQAVVKAMLVTAPDHSRSIINITSVSAQASSPERLDYCISKAGLAAFSQGLALRLAADGVAVFEVRPGIVRTDMTAGVTPKYDALIAGGLVPMRRWGEAGDIGAICAALASGSFAFATGTVIDADGGLSIPRL